MIQCIFQSTWAKYGLPVAAVVLAIGCRDASENPLAYNPKPYPLSVPAGLPPVVSPANNPLTVDGVALGKALFFDPILSKDNKQSCGSCHRQKYAFSDSTIRFSVGVDGIEGTRNAMPIFNLAYAHGFFWDGGAEDLESQVVGPIQNPVEMHETLPNVLTKLRASSHYKQLFYKAFGTDSITIPLLMRAIAQYERTLLSGNSRYDKYVRKEPGGTLTAQELRGLAIYSDETKGDCFHCHSLGSTFTDFEYRNNGLDANFTADLGRFRVTQLDMDKGKFKTPTLRNIAVTGPYMHDGRFATLEACIEHYNTGIQPHPTLDPVLAHAVKGRMTAQDVQDLAAFLHTLTDDTFIGK